MNYPTRSVQFIISDIHVKTPPAEVIYNMIGRSSPDVLTNKTMTDPSNTIAASYVNAGGSNISIAGGPTGGVLTLTSPTAAAFVAPAAPAPAIPDVVRITASALTLSAGVWYLSFNAPTNLVGTSASSITISSNVLGGQRISSTKQMYCVNMTLCLQYQSQPGQSRTFANINVNDVAVFGCAESVPGGTNNWRSSQNGITYGIPAGSFLNVTASTNAIGTLTLNSAVLFIQLI
jgi:hypothetical protein